jgi:hypothetical protein
MHCERPRQRRERWSGSAAACGAAAQAAMQHLSGPCLSAQAEMAEELKGKLGRRRQAIDEEDD